MSLFSQIAGEYVRVCVCARACARAYEEGVGGRCDFEYANDRRLYVWEAGEHCLARAKHQS
jgi:hypothetical protein